MTLHHLAIRSWLLLLLFLTGPGLMGSATAQEDREVAGKVIIATAGSVARDPKGEERPLRRRSQVYTGDTIVTAAKGRVQIRFSDGALLGLKPNSEFRVEQYHYEDGADGSENAVYKLLKGGMRTITGAIGKTREENYKVETEAATIGIRGTHYILQICSAGCGEQQAKGVFGGVVNGAISVSNDAGESIFGRDQYFQVTGSDAAPRELLRPPEFLADTAPIREQDEDQQDEGDSGESGDGDEDEGSGTTEEGGNGNADGGDARDESSLDTDTTETTLETISEYQSTEEVTSSGESTATDDATTDRSKLPAGGALGLTFIEHEDVDGFQGEGGVLFTGNQVTAYVETVDNADNIPVAVEVWFQPDLNDPDDEGCQPCILEIDQDSGRLLDVGGNVTLGVNWGRWEGSFSLEENGQVLQTSGSSHFIYSPNVTPLSTVQSLTGQFYYTGLEATPPTDQSGNVGILGSAYLLVDFDLQQLDEAGLYVSFPDQDRDYALNMDPYDQPLPLEDLYTKDPPSDIHMVGGCNGAGCGEQTAEGHMGVTFIGPEAEGAIGTYGFREGQEGDGSISDHGVTGTILFQQGEPAM